MISMDPLVVGEFD